MILEEQQIALAKWAGFTGIRFDWINASDGIKDWMHDGGRGIPYYTCDLNAVHKLEKRLTEEQWANYEYELSTLSGATVEGTRNLVCATATQRCEALLKTLGLWKS